MLLMFSLYCNNTSCSSELKPFELYPLAQMRHVLEDILVQHQQCALVYSPEAALESFESFQEFLKTLGLGDSMQGSSLSVWTIMIVRSRIGDRSPLLAALFLQLQYRDVPTRP